MSFRSALPYLVEGLGSQQRHGEAEGVEGELHAPCRRGKVRVLVGLVSPRSHRLGVGVLLWDKLQRDEKLACVRSARRTARQGGFAEERGTTGARDKMDGTRQDARQNEQQVGQTWKVVAGCGGDMESALFGERQIV